MLQRTSMESFPLNIDAQLDALPCKGIPGKHVHLSSLQPIPQPWPCKKAATHLQVVTSSRTDSHHNPSAAAFQ